MLAFLWAFLCQIIMSMARFWVQRMKRKAGTFGNLSLNICLLYARRQPRWFCRVGLCQRLCRSHYKMPKPDKSVTRQMYNELAAFSLPLLFATAVQSVSQFFDTSSIQYALTLCDKAVLSKAYNYFDGDIFTYVFGIYSSALDFKNLIPGMVMALGVTAVPAISSAYESDSPKFNLLINSVLKYTSILSCFSGIVLALFPSEILTLFYGNSNGDIAKFGSDILFYLAVTVLPCCLASSCVFCAQSLGLSKKTILPFAVSGGIRVITNIILIPKMTINISAVSISNL